MLLSEPVRLGLKRRGYSSDTSHDVTITSRSVNLENQTNVRTVRADASDAGAFTQVCKGQMRSSCARCAAYDRWPTDFFPIMDGLTRAAENVGAKLIVLGNLYGYGSNPEGLLGPDQPLDPSSRKGTVRTIMWQRALRASVPAIEVRASDYLGKGAVTYFSLLALPSLLASKPVTFRRLWTRATLVIHQGRSTHVGSRCRIEGAWDRAFHVPSHHISPREPDPADPRLSSVKSRPRSDVLTCADGRIRHARACGDELSLRKAAAARRLGHGVSPRRGSERD